MRGPPAKAAYAKGLPTKALEGFCAKNGIAIADVFVEADPKSKGVEYVWADVRDEGRGAAQVRGQKGLEWAGFTLGNGIDTSAKF